MLVILGLKDPPPPIPVCINDKVFLFHPMGANLQQTMKTCTDEPCIVFPISRKMLRDSSFRP